MKDLFGGFSDRDGTLDFYLRIQSVTTSDMSVLDLGAGRGAWAETKSSLKRNITQIRGRVREIIAADVDPVVLENPTCDRAVLIRDGRIPLPDSSIDLIICDFVLEHITDPAGFVAEANRVLKDGGWFCARTPHKFNYIALASRMLPGTLENFVLSRAQPNRKSEDVFPKVYKMNTCRDLHQWFAGWSDRSFIYRAEPSYFFGRTSIYWIMDIFHRLLPAFSVGVIMVFKQKIGSTSAIHQDCAPTGSA